MKKNKAYLALVSFIEGTTRGNWKDFMGPSFALGKDELS